MYSRKVFVPLLLGMVVLLICCQRKVNSDKESTVAGNYPIKGVLFSKVKIQDQLWSERIETNKTVTIPSSFAKCEENGRMDNFLIAGGKMEGKVKGKMVFDDSDVYKVIEGAAYSLTTNPDPAIGAYMDSIIDIISIGQEDDGYLTTYKTIDTTYSPSFWCPPGGRWQNLNRSHELYNAGHMYEAAAAHYLATGKSNFLDIATKNADLLVSVFRKGSNKDFPGHQIVETGLVKLYLITKKQEYLDLAKHFLDARGDSTNVQHEAYTQSHKPVVEQDEAVGHAVRAAYMYAGMTDIAALYNDEAYKKAINAIWENMVYKKFYITGGLGARHDGEAFGDNYELPNLTAYNETCAAIANVYWNYRMFLLYGDSKYIDVLERSLYNNVLSGIGLDGKSFFYPNPLSCDLEYKFNSMETLTRQPWFDCSCCPTNLCRFIPSVPGYIYANQDDKLFVNLFVSSEFEQEFKSSIFKIKQETAYPWDGRVDIKINPEQKAPLAFYIRIPGWAIDRPVPGDLYAYENPSRKEIALFVNGERVKYQVDKGYAVINREWSKGDKITMYLPMDIKKVKANNLVEEDRGKIALERGPIVYCLEGADNPEIDNISLNQEVQLKTLQNQKLFGGTTTIIGENAKSEKVLEAIPYYLWNNRGASKLKVWLPFN